MSSTTYQNRISAVLCASAPSALRNRFARFAAVILLALAPGLAFGQDDAAKVGTDDLPEGAFEDAGPGRAVRSITPIDRIDAADPSNLLDRRTEAAIVRGLNYLKNSQDPDGRWAGEDSNWIAYNALSMIAFMLSGHFPGSDQPYGPMLSKALDALLAETEGPGNGFVGTSMYAHGLATLCLSEVWGHTNQDERVHDSLKAGVTVILRAQSEAGGWRYAPEPGGADVSVTAMQVIALAAARQAGIYVPDSTIDRAVRYVNLCHHAESGGFTYMAGFGVPGFARSGAATMSLMMLGRHEEPEVKSGVRYIMEQGPSVFEGTPHYMYGHYYAALVMYQAGAKEFEQWYPRIRDILIARQTADGNIFIGSNRYAYDTAFGTIILSIPYGYVPAYQR